MMDAVEVNLRGLAWLMLGWVVSAAGCFTEPPASDTCQPGASGCPCRADGSCNGTLECNNDSNCVDPNCVDGTQSCPCINATSCVDDLACVAGICNAASGTDTASATMSTSSMMTSAESSDESSTAAPETTATETTFGTSPGSTGEMCARALECPPQQACLDGQCVQTDYGPCTESKHCGPEADCDTVLALGVCTPSCGTASVCPPLRGHQPTCSGTLCTLGCKGDGDCPDYAGMLCLSGRCVYG